MEVLFQLIDQGCCYIAMIFTKWGGVADEPDEKDEYGLFHIIL